MPGFSNADELYRYIGGIFEKGFADAELGPQMEATGIVFSMRCDDLDSAFTVDMGSRKVHPSGEGPEPQAALIMSSETANAYWQGKVNLPFAMARGKVKVEGNVAKLLALSPLGKKLFPAYVETLKEDGREDLVVA